MKYNFEIIDGILRIGVEEQSNCRYAAYLLQNGQVKEKQFYREKAEFKFSLKEEGKYRIKLFEKNLNEEINTEETDEIVYKKIIKVGCFNSFEQIKADEVVIEQIAETSFQIEITSINKWNEYTAIILDLKDEIPVICEEFGNLKNIIENKEKEKELYQKYFLLGKQLEQNYSGLFFIIDRFGRENEEYAKEEEFYVLEVVYAALRQTLYRIYSISVPYFMDYKMAIKNSVEYIKDIIFHREIDFDVFLCQENNVLKTWLDGEFQEGDKYFFYLIKNGKVISNSGWITKTSFQWEVTETGIYCIQGYIMRNNHKSIKKSLPVFFSTESDKKMYEEFLTLENIEETKKLSFYEAEEPYCDFAIVNLEKNSLMKNTDFEIPKTNLKIVHTWENADYDSFVLSNGKLLEIEDKKILFSGECVIGEQFISSVQEKEQLGSAIKELFGAIGTFTILEIERESCRVYTDYYGFGRVFSLKKEGISIVSNRYGLILKLMDKLNLEKNLYFEKVKVLLSTVSVQLLQQNIIREMNIKDIIQILPEEALEWKQGEWKKIKSALGQEISEFIPFHRCNYKRDLTIAAKEILKNIDVILESNSFEYIISDLTGGLDSRVIYAGLTNFIEKKDKVRINAQDTPQSRDLEIAIKLNGMYNFLWDDLKEEWIEKDIEEVREKLRSAYIGTYYAIGRNNRIIGLKDKIRLTGGGGDFCARPYYSRKYFNSIVRELSDVKRFIRYISSDYAANLIIDGKEFEKFNEIMVEELSSNPMEYMTNLERFNYLYFAYRNGFHFHNILSHKLGIPCFMPILSKQLYKLNLQTHNLFQSVRLQLDLIEELNPLLVCIPFDGKTDEEDRKQMKLERNQNQSPIFCIQELELCENKENWERAQIEKRKNRKITKDTEKKEESLKNEYESVCFNLRKLIKIQPEFKEIGASLYYWILNNKEKQRYLVFLNNKIQSILDEIE